MTTTASNQATTHVVYVHGAGRHKVGYAECWWKALLCHSPGILNNTDAYAFHEVRWNKEDDDYRVSAEPPQDCNGHGEFPQNWIQLVAQRDIRRGESDVGRYLVDASFREEAIRRCGDILRQLIALPKSPRIVMLGHSLGTVVGIDTLHQLSADPQMPQRAIETWITVGSPLAWLVFQQHIQQRSRPEIVEKWVNVMDTKDFVHQAAWEVAISDVYTGVVDHTEDLDVNRKNCNDLPFFIGDLCAHMHYFHAANLKVNQYFAQHFE